MTELRVERAVSNPFFHGNSTFSTLRALESEKFCHIPRDL
jgi:hypothetical protein